MQNKLNQLIGKSFIFSTLVYEVKEVKIVSQRAVIVTNRRTFTFYESELDDFFSGIVICDPSDMKVLNNELPVITEEKQIWEKQAEIVERKKEVFNVEIIQSNEISSKMSSKLMEVFDQISASPTEQNMKKAKAMVDVSNAVVNVQMAQFKFLTLKNK